VKVVEAGNMTAAAQRLGLAQPALGAQIKQLEDELGVALLLRHSRGVSPTQAGKLLHERARAILADVERTRAELRAMGARAQDNLVLGVNPSIVLMLGADLLLRAREEMPGVHASLVEERTPVLLDALDRGQVDIAFLYNIEGRPGLERRAVIEEDLLLVTAPTGEPAPATVSLAEALDHDLAIAGSRGVIRRIVESEARRLALRMRLAWEVHSVSSMKAMIARGEAASILPYSLAAEELRAGTLVARRIDRPAITRTLYVVRPEERAPFVHEEQIAAFLGHVVDGLLERIGPYARRLS
jgi:LysR family transcriptional regulator, nitrogen assimilation regulatory protein